jgi:outer membrane protein OmpA-like peptidoglycan-associated protein
MGLSGCSPGEPLSTPVDWWHDLEGGEVAATRPPPPGADLPYPKLGTIPPKPVLPSRSFRDTVQTQLTEQRDDTQRLAARNPIEPQQAVPPPPAPQPAPADGSAAAETANATLPGADAPPPAPGKPAPTASAAPLASDGGPAPGTPVTLAGAQADSGSLVVPDAPPAPASFEGVPAQPAPTPPPPLPAHLPASQQGTQVLFATGSAVLDPSQNETLGTAKVERGKGRILIEGHGETQSDAPAAQEAAIGLGLKRAQAVAVSLVKMGVPPEQLILSATAFGRGASLRDDEPPPVRSAAPGSRAAPAPNAAQPVNIQTYKPPG